MTSIGGPNHATPYVNSAFQSTRVWLNEIASGKNSYTTTSPAKLMIGNRLLNTAQRSSVANMNVGFATSRAQTVDSYLQGTHDTVSRLKELSVQANNGLLTDNDRDAINAEAQELMKHLGQTYQTARFNGQEVLQGGTADVAVTADGDKATVTNGDTSFAKLGIEGLDLSTQEGAEAALEALDTATDEISNQRAQIGTDLRKLEDQYEANLAAEANLREASSNQMDTDIARASTEFSTPSIRSQVASAVASQGNQLQGSMISALL